MTANGFSQAELARRVGLAQPTIYSLLHSNKIGSKHLHKIARELGTTPAYLSGETDNPLEDVPAAPMLTHDEKEWVDLYRRMDEMQRRSALIFLRGFIDPPAPDTVHSPKTAYGAQPGSA